MRRLMRSFFRLLKKDSATALSQRLPRRLMLGAGSWSLLPAYEVVAAELTIARDSRQAGLHDGAQPAGSAVLVVPWNLRGSATSAG
jgi:hypothetical protein